MPRSPLTMLQVTYSQFSLTKFLFTSPLLLKRDISSPFEWVWKFIVVQEAVPSRMHQQWWCILVILILLRFFKEKVGLTEERKKSPALSWIAGTKEAQAIHHTPPYMESNLIKVPYLKLCLQNYSSINLQRITCHYITLRPYLGNRRH